MKAWKSEEFMETVYAGIISFYEGKRALGTDKNGKDFFVSDNQIEKIKKRGLYFPPEDRLLLNHLDTIGNPILPPPNVAFCTARNENPTLIDLNIDPLMESIPDGTINGYINHLYIEPCSYWPRGAIRKGYGNIYRLTVMLALAKGGFVAGHDYLTIDGKGGISYPDYSRCGYPGWRRAVQEEAGRDSAMQATICYNIFADRKHLWLVKVSEKKYGIYIGVYSEEIKSLFYSRKAPMTESGRKRPLLHWVRSHTRRLKEGHEIDIEKHLRGNERFVMDGIEFSITQPLKKTNNTDLGKR